MTITWVTGCKPGVPREYIQPRELEKILYDYHIADGMAMTDGNYEDVNYRRTVYREAALRKHGVTQAELDSSLVYYYRHTELLHDVYVRLAKRLNDESLALGSTANEMSQLGADVAQGDTSTVWTNPQSVVLFPVAPYNVISFDVKADTSYHEGDRLMLHFDAQFIFQDGMRDGVAMLAVTYRNDSVATQVTHVSNNSHFVVQAFDHQRLGIKQVKGFIYLSQGQNNQTQTLKLMCVKNMRLLKMKTKPVETKDEETTPDKGGHPSDSAHAPSPPHPVSTPLEPVSMRPSVDEKPAPPPPAPTVASPGSDTRRREIRKREP